MNPISIADRRDIPALVELLNSAYRGEASKKGWTTEADLLGGQRTDAAMIEEEMSMPAADFLKYTDPSGLLTGCVYLKKSGNKLYLGMLSVSPQLQNGGIGKQLLQAAETYASEKGCHQIYMTVISVRRELIAWYERHGYQATGERMPFEPEERFGIPTQPLEFIVLEKKLTRQKS